MFQFFPFSNAHQLNLDWILETISKLPWTVNNTYPDELHNINLPQVSGMSSWNGIGADGAGNVNPLENIADLDNAGLDVHFYHWSNPSTAHNPYDGDNMISQEGFCISYQNFGGYIVQLAWGAGGKEFAVRSLTYGNPWTSWSYPIVSKDIQTNIVLNSTNLDLNEFYNIQAKVQNGWCFGYVEASCTGILSGNMELASGFPVPLMEPATAHFMGVIKDINTSELSPCRFGIDSTGKLLMDYMGNTQQAGDVIAVSFSYPIK